MDRAALWRAEQGGTGSFQGREGIARPWGGHPLADDDGPGPGPGVEHPRIRGLAAVGRQVGQDLPAILVSLGPAGQQRACQATLRLAGKGHAAALPSAAHSRDELPERLGSIPALGAEFA